MKIYNMSCEIIKMRLQKVFAQLKFKFSKKAKKFKETVQFYYVNMYQINWEISSTFCGLQRKPELEQLSLYN